MKSEKYLLVKGLKSLSTSSSTDLPGGPLKQLSKVQNRFIVPKLHSRTLQHVFELKKKKINQGPESNSVFPIEMRVVNGNMINNHTNSKFPSPNTPQALQSLPLPCHSAEYFGSSSTAASGCVAVSVSPPTSFFWPWRVSAPELESTLSTPSCDIRPSSFSCQQCSETNKKSPVRSKSISQILRSRPRDRDTGQHQNLAAGETQRGNLFLTLR